MHVKGNNDRPDPTDPQRGFGNPLKEGGQGDAEGSRMNKKGGFGSDHTSHMEARTG